MAFDNTNPWDTSNQTPFGQAGYSEPAMPQQPIVGQSQFQQEHGGQYGGAPEKSGGGLGSLVKGAIGATPVGMGVLAGTQVLKGAFGLSQYLKGRKAAKSLQRPTYQIPEEVKQNLNQSQLMALEGMPEEQRQQFIQGMQRNLATSLQASSSRKGGLAGIAGIAQTQADAMAGLTAQDAAMKQANQKDLMAQKSVMAQYKDKAFQANVMDPYTEKRQAAQSMMGAGIQNVGGALDTLAGGFITGG